MSHVHEQKVPRPALYGALALILFSIGLAAFSRRAHATPEASAPATFVDLRFEDRADGAVRVLDAADGHLIAEVPPGTNGFVRGVVRGMYRTRKLESLDRSASFRLSREANGRLNLLDLADGRRVDLDSFGPTNAHSFAQILDAGRPR